jgi:signal peptidase
MSSVGAKIAHDRGSNPGSAANTALPSLWSGPASRLPGASLRAGRVLAAGVQWSVLAVAIVAFLGLGVLPRLGAYRTLTVLSGSMKPAFGPGDLIVTRPQPVSTLKVGDIITYHIPVADHHLETHRVVRLWRKGDHVTVVTEGDANLHADPWKARLRGTTAWRQVAVVPKVGWAIVWLRHPNVRRLGLFGAPALLVVLGLLAIWRRPEPTDERGPGSTEQGVAEPKAAPIRDAAPVVAVLEPKAAPIPDAAPMVAELEPEPMPLRTVTEAVPKAQARPLVTVGTGGEWNLSELESLVSAHEAEHPLRAEECGFYLEAMRDYADAAGQLPARFDWLVWDTFGEWLSEATKKHAERRESVPAYA